MNRQIYLGVIIAFCLAGCSPDTGPAKTVARTETTGPRLTAVTTPAVTLVRQRSVNNRIEVTLRVATQPLNLDRAAPLTVSGTPPISQRLTAQGAASQVVLVFPPRGQARVVRLHESPTGRTTFPPDLPKPILINLTPRPVASPRPPRPVVSPSPQRPPLKPLSPRPSFPRDERPPRPPAPVPNPGPKDEVELLPSKRRGGG